MPLHTQDTSFPGDSEGAARVRRHTVPGPGPEDSEDSTTKKKKVMPDFDFLGFGR